MGYKEGLKHQLDLSNREKTVVKSFVKGCILVFAIALTARSVMFLYNLNIDPGSFSRCEDCRNYIQAAKNLLWYGVFSEAEAFPLYPGIFRTPAYPAFVAAAYYAAGCSDAAVVLVQVLLSSLTCVIIYMISLRYVSKYAAFSASLLLALDIVSIKNSNEILTETLFTFILVILIVIFVLFMEKNRMGYLVLGGLLAGTGAMVRPILLYFGLFTITPFLFYYRNYIRKVILYYLVFNLAFLSVVGPWIARNLNAGYRGFSAVQEFNIYNYKAGWIEERLRGTKDSDYIDFDRRQRRVYEILEERGIENTPGNRVKIYREVGVKTVMEHPELLLRYQVIYTTKIFTVSGTQSFLDQVRNWTGKSLPNSVTGLISAGYYALLWIAYLTFIMGILRKDTWRRFRGAFLVAALLLYLTVLSGEWGAESRFRIPLMPLVAIISAGGFEYLFKLISRQYFKHGYYEKKI